MRITIAAIGRLKDGGERVLVDRYVERLAGARSTGFGPMAERELPEARQGTAAERRADEAQRLLKAIDGADLVVGLDAAGRQMSSEAFAKWLGDRRDAGSRHAAFLIGGADGHGDEIAERSHLVLSLGPMTLPHGLARAVLAEQIYRSTTILSGHPYHRA